MRRVPRGISECSYDYPGPMRGPLDQPSRVAADRGPLAGGGQAQAQVIPSKPLLIPLPAGRHGQGLRSHFLEAKGRPSLGAGLLVVLHFPPGVRCLGMAPPAEATFHGGGGEMCMALASSSVEQAMLRSQGRGLWETVLPAREEGQLVRESNPHRCGHRLNAVPLSHPVRLMCQGGARLKRVSKWVRQKPPACPRCSITFYALAPLLSC